MSCMDQGIYKLRMLLFHYVFSLWSQMTWRETDNSFMTFMHENALFYKSRFWVLNLTEVFGTVRMQTWRLPADPL